MRTGSQRTVSFPLQQQSHDPLAHSADLFTVTRVSSICAAISHSLTLASPVGHVAVMDECLLTPSWVCSITNHCIDMCGGSALFLLPSSSSSVSWLAISWTPSVGLTLLKVSFQPLSLVLGSSSAAGYINKVKLT